MKISKRRYHFTAQNPEDTKVLGQHVPVWPPDGGEEFKVWGSMDDLSSNESLIAAAVGSKVTHIINIRFDKRVTTKTRLILDGQIMEINGVIAIKNKREMNITCTERK